jgi:hypothetical protein
VSEDKKLAKIMINNEAILEHNIFLSNYIDVREMRYMPPECLETRRKTITSNWWSLGIIL